MVLSHMGSGGRSPTRSGANYTFRNDLSSSFFIFTLGGCPPATRELENWIFLLTQLSRCIPTDLVLSLVAL